MCNRQFFADSRSRVLILQKFTEGTTPMPRTKKRSFEEMMIAGPILTAMVARPSFYVALAWIQAREYRQSKKDYPTSVGAIRFELEHTWGAVVSREVVAVALETSGYKVAPRSFGYDMARELAVNIRRSSVNHSPWRNESPRPERWFWAKDTEPLPGVELLYRDWLRH